MKTLRIALLAMVGILSLTAKAEMPESIELKSMIECFYDPTFTPANYYFVLTDNSDATYDANTGTLRASNAWTLMLDLYNAESNPAVLPAGLYKEGNGTEELTYDTEFTLLRHYDASGNIDTEAFINGTIVVKQLANGMYSIDAMSGSTNITFTGSLSFSDITQGSSVYGQIRQDLDLNCTYGAIAYYHGNLFQSNTGNIYIDMYTNAFNPETGGMIEEGYSVNMCAFNKLFGDPKSAKPIAGTYTMARNFARETYYPGMEIDYMGVTVQMGAYVKHKSSKYPDGYAYAYLQDGTMVIVENEDGTYTITVDCITDLGFHVKSTFTGEVPVEDLSDDKGKVSISTLEDDVELDLDKLPVSHIWNGGYINGCQSFILDIGSPSGRDKELDNGGDCIRIEFLLEDGTQRLQEGTYTVITNRYASSYAPFHLEQGHFSSSANGDLIGTRYFYFLEGRYYIAHHFVPCVEGTVSVTKTENTMQYQYRDNPPQTLECYRFDIHLVDDAGFHLDGQWEGGMELMYNPDAIASVETVGIDEANQPAANRISATEFELLNAEGVQLTVTDMSGIVRMSQMGGKSLNISGLADGMYILKLGHKVVKFLK